MVEVIGDLINYYKDPRLKKLKQKYYAIKKAQAKRLREEMQRKIKEELEKRNEEARRRLNGNG